VSRLKNSKTALQAKSLLFTSLKDCSQQLVHLKHFSTKNCFSTGPTFDLMC